MESNDQSTDHDTRSYMCFPLSQIEKNHLEEGNNIIMPASALSSSQKLVCRMTFRIAKSNRRRTFHHHCGVAEFTADDGFVFMPTWMMKKLNIREGDLVDVKDTSLPEGNYVKFAKQLDYYKHPRRMRLLELIREILEEDDTIYQPKKKKLRYQQSSEAKKQQIMFTPFTGKMDVNLPDDVIRIILAKLPTKILVQSRCVSAHWNRLISDSFVKSRSCRKILVVAPHFQAIYVPCSEDVLKLPDSHECHKTRGRYIKVIGTFNGIVVLVVNHRKCDKTTPKFTSHIILYNPLTSESEIFPDPYSPFYEYKMHIYGFGYGATKDDLKIVRFRGLTNPDYNWNTCDVFNLKDRSWSTSTMLIEVANFWDDVGTFINGYLYWLADNKIVALNVKEMVISDIHLPFTRINNTETHLGTLHGCLWMITDTQNCFEFNMWVMKMEEGVKNSWSESHLLTLDLEGKYKYGFQVINVMDDGRILMLGAGNVLIIYDTSKNSYKILETPSLLSLYSAKAIDYEESMTSPSII